MQGDILIQKLKLFDIGLCKILVRWDSLYETDKIYNLVASFFVKCTPDSLLKCFKIECNVWKLHSS